jgi:hypothetical protein
MRYMRFLIMLAGLVLIVIMSLCGTLALTNSNLYPLLNSFVNNHWPSIISKLPLVIWGVMFVFGFQSITLRNTTGEGFTWLIIILSLPSILSFNSLDIPKILGLNMAAKTQMTFYGTLGLGALIMASYVLLAQMSMFNKAHRSQIRRNVDTKDIDYCNLKSHLTLLLATGGTLLVVAIIAVIAYGVEALTSTYLADVPWSIILVSLGCIMILAVYIYWLGSQHNPV